MYLPYSQDLIIEATAIDTCDPFVQNVTLYYRETGSGDPYTPIAMSQIVDSLYQGIIPGSVVLPGTPGVDYYLTATDGQATVSDPPNNPQLYPYQIEICPSEGPVIVAVWYPADSCVWLGNDFPIMCEVFDTTDWVEMVQLFYRQTGQILYKNTTMADQGGNQYLGVVPGSYVGPTGIDYYIRAVDNHGLAGYYGSDISPIHVDTCGVPHVPPVDVPYDTCVYQGKMACIPVYLDSLPPWSVYSAQWVMYYDEAVLHATHATTENSIAEAWGEPTYHIEAGWISIAMGGIDSLDTTGVLAWVCFDVVGEIGDTTLLTFEDDQIILNDSTFDAREGLVRVCPEEYIICGRVRYCLNDEPVRCAELMLSGGKDDTVHANANGCYCFPHLPVGLDYTVKADKTDDYRGAISAFDASLVLRYVVSLLDLTPCQLIAGDVTGNCWVNAYDASFILKRVVHLIPQFPIGKDWKFIPDDFLLDTLNWCTAPDSIFYDSLSEDWCFEDWKGILYGDLSGNWGSVLLAGRDHPEDILSRLVVKDIMVNPGEEFIVPIQVEDVSELYSAELGLSYDNSLLSLESVTPGDLLSGCYFEKNLTPGEIRLAAAGTQPIQGSGDLAYLTFKVLPQAQEGTTTELQVSRFCLNEASTGGFAFNVSIGSGTTTHPIEFSLAQNYPNPFNPETEIGFSLPVDCRVQLRIYNVTGQLVKVLYQKDYPAGAHSISWDGTNMKGENVGSGIYFYRMEAGDFVQQKKMVLMR